MKHAGISLIASSAARSICVPAIPHVAARPIRTGFPSKLSFQANRAAQAR